VGKPRIGKLRSLSSKYSMFTSILLLWVVATSLWWDIHLHTFDWTKGLVLCGIVLGIAAAISQFTNRLLARPLTLLEAGITSVREGRLEPIRVSRTGDEIEYLGESFNRMIAALAASQDEIKQYQELLEERIRQRTQDLEQAMHGALAASQAKSEFLANISHELRTPMNGLLGMLDLVLDSHVGGEQREQVEIAQRCAYSLLDLLNDILDLSKIEAGRMILEKVPFDIRSIVEDCVRAQGAKAAQKGVELRFEYVGEATNVTGDPLRLRQIVTNLLSNAIKFTDKGWVTVRQSVSAGADGKINMVLDVADTGSGIPSDKVPLIFEKFTQADSSISRKYGGTGLGLAITKRLVELQFGQIRVESRVGQGSTFTVEISFEIAPAAAPAAELRHEKRTAPPVARHARLLLVEDNAVNQRVVLAMLRKKDYQIDVANNGQEALEKLARATEPYNLVLMDVQMPVLDGLETTRAIRRNSNWDYLPIIAMTAHAMIGDRERCLQAGMNAYVSKPVQQAGLIAEIEKHLVSGTAPATAPQTSAVERVLTDKLMQQDRALVSEMLRLFMEVAPERLEKLATAAAHGDAETLAKEAKRIGAAAEHIAATSLGQCARSIGDAAARGDFGAVKADVEALRREIRSLEALTP
jgi:signal transduction histidine kinase/CheY-like chemotaxis protein/HPt (histidine-containing phosphotransfer) domain-containing protein